MRSNNDEMPNFNDAPEEPADQFNPDSDPSFVVSDEPKKVNKTTLFLLAVVALGGAGLYVMHLKSGPKPAAAQAQQAADAGKAITQFLSGGQTNIKAMEEMLANTEKVVQKFLAYPQVTQIPLSELQTNPFRLAPASGEEENGSGPSAAELKRREEERQAILKAVQALQLQTVLVSADRKSCMINNAMYREGQQVSGFTIESIRTGSVIVRNGQYRFEIKMQR